MTIALDHTIGSSPAGCPRTPRGPPPILHGHPPLLPGISPDLPGTPPLPRGHPPISHWSPPPPPETPRTSRGTQPIPARHPPILPGGPDYLIVQYTAVFGRHVLTFTNPENGRLAKPFGAAAIQLFMSIGDKSVYDHGSATMLGTFTKNPIVVPFESSDDRKFANYAARWMSRRGETGPWSNPRSLRIAA